MYDAELDPLAALCALVPGGLQQAEVGQRCLERCRNSLTGGLGGSSLYRCGGGPDAIESVPRQSLGRWPYDLPRLSSLALRSSPCLISIEGGLYPFPRTSPYPGPSPLRLGSRPARSSLGLSGGSRNRSGIL